VFLYKTLLRGFSRCYVLKRSRNLQFVAGTVLRFFEWSRVVQEETDMASAFDEIGKSRSHDIRPVSLGGMQNF
jgi:hypothetical protein